MTSPDFAVIAPKTSSTAREDIDTQLKRLVSKKDEWVRVSTRERAEILSECLNATAAIAAEWTRAACEAKGIDFNSAGAGEEWVNGAIITMRVLNQTRHAMMWGGEPPVPSIKKREGTDQYIAQVMPNDIYDRVLFTGMTADVWIEPGKPPSQGKVYRDKRNKQNVHGGVSLVLGAGNQASIGPLDVIYKLFVEDEVVIVKMNPVNAYLKPYWEEALRPLVKRGYLSIVRGGAEVGAYLCEHPDVTSIHITGSDQTHDAIVFGADPKERAQRKAENRPKLQKPISSELGAVTPVIIVPGNWSSVTLRYQARQVASMMANNASFNCNAAKLLVTAKNWPQREEFLAQVQNSLAKLPARFAYYPGAHGRYQEFLKQYPNQTIVTSPGSHKEGHIPWTLFAGLSSESQQYAFTNEAFCAILAETSLDARDAGDFLDKATEFANNRLWGTLSATMLISPGTKKRFAAQYDRAIDKLRYGGIGVNGWSALVYGLGQTTWGAYPGHSLTDIQSGRGVVHNTFLFDYPQKSVVTVPFMTWPTPFWFVDHKTMSQLAPKLCEFYKKPSVPKMLSLLPTALRA